MAKKNRKARRQRAISARQNAAQNTQGSFIANELNHLIGADEEDVVRAYKWRAKQNVIFIYAVNAVICAFLVFFTLYTSGTGLSKFVPFIWVGFIALFLAQQAMLKRYKRLIRNA
ncbi:hypothetical protein [Vreelandella titanicae]|uniref:2TM domain-containing protein n=1 Tax=Vreelandella titanicae TaxID=664683 RepID=A0A558J0X4_9GAMM|nr:hypothetical protein [Halomonas titanicae]TVU87295.1 hypothetical protein FQP89_22185 [Halomonas titanicae]